MLKRHKYNRVDEKIKDDLDVKKKKKKYAWQLQTNNVSTDNMGSTNNTD